MVSVVWLEKIGEPFQDVGMNSFLNRFLWGHPEVNEVSAP
jgi:hypothetical protein